MANAFDRFDSENPFDRFDQQQPSGKKVSITDKVARGVVDPIDGAAQLVTHLLPQGVVSAGNKFNNWLADKGVPVARIPEGGMDELVRSGEQEYQAGRLASGDTGFDWARLGGNIASPANIVAATRAAKLTSLIPGMSGKVASGVAAGATQSALMPVTQGAFAGEKAKQIGLGAAIGGVVPVAGKVIPQRSKAAKELQAQGVRVPFLQQFGQGAGRVEDKLQSVPLLGDAIRSSRFQSRDDFNRATWNKVLEPLGEKLPKNVLAGNKAAEYVQGKISSAYDDVLSKIGFSADQQFTQDINSLKGLASQLPQEQADQFNRILQVELFDQMTPAGLMAGQSIKRAESRIGEKMRTAMRSQNVWDNDLADALHEAQAIIRNTLERQNPQHAGVLQAVNKAQAMSYRPERAASMLGAKEGVFTPSQLLSAIKSKDPTKNKRAFAQGRSMMQDWAQKADETLSSKIPDSGTTERLLLGGGALGGLGMVPTAGQVAAGLATLPYLPYGGRALGRGIANTLDKTANALTNRPAYPTLFINPAINGLLYSGQ